MPIPSESDIFTALGNWIQSVIPGVEVVQGQLNRVPEPVSPNFVIMTTMFRERLATNIDTYADCQFTGSVAADQLTISAIQFGKVRLGSNIWDVAGDIPIGTTIISGPSSGLLGIYTLSASVGTVASEKMACGNQTLTQKTQLSIQLDVHSPNLTVAGDNATTIATLFRSERAIDFFSAYPGLAPLYTDEPRQVPFINAESQYESRYVITAILQADQAITLPQQFADQLQVTIEPPVDG
jgi:hypothetical protein